MGYLGDPCQAVTEEAALGASCLVAVGPSTLPPPGIHGACRPLGAPAQRNPVPRPLSAPSTCLPHSAKFPIQWPFLAQGARADLIIVVTWEAAEGKQNGRSPVPVTVCQGIQVTERLRIALNLSHPAPLACLGSRRARGWGWVGKDWRHGWLLGLCLCVGGSLRAIEHGHLTQAVA